MGYYKVKRVAKENGSKNYVATLHMEVTFVGNVKRAVYSYH